MMNNKTWLDLFDLFVPRRRNMGDMLEQLGFDEES
jgi:hypothetical protein